MLESCSVALIWADITGHKGKMVAAGKPNARASTQAGAPVSAGASVFARLTTVKVYAEPRAASRVMGTLKRSEEAIATDEERDGFVKIDGKNIAGGWVLRTLVATQPAPH